MAMMYFGALFGGVVVFGLTLEGQTMKNLQRKSD